MVSANDQATTRAKKTNGKAQSGALCSLFGRSLSVLPNTKREGGKSHALAAEKAGSLLLPLGFPTTTHLDTPPSSAAALF